MASKTKVTVPTVQAFTKALAEIEGVTKNAIRKTVIEAVENAADLSPRRTGHNASTITWDEIPGGFRIYTQSGYGGYLELLWTPRQDKPKAGEAGKPARADGGRHYIRRGLAEAARDVLYREMKGSI